MFGMRASLTYLVGRLLGYDMKFYHGWWHDWGARDLPYVTGTAAGSPVGRRLPDRLTVPDGSLG